jgi:hypothetical protein
MPNPKALKTAPKGENDIIWGAAEIAAEVGLTPGKVYYHFALGNFRDAVWRFSARKLVASRKRLRELRFVTDTTTAA